VATADSTAGTFFAMECVESPGGGTPLHVHTREDEFFYVSEGVLSIYVDGKTVELVSGQSIFAPRNVPHCFKNRTGKPVRFLVVCTPHDIEAFFDYGLPLPGGGAPSDEKIIERIMAMAPEYGLQIVGPSPL
jgi:oxalate decarboxylase/phosphoglucose isomerase-like protein (cupin superfamily)